MFINKTVKKISKMLDIHDIDHNIHRMDGMFDDYHIYLTDYGYKLLFCPYISMPMFLYDCATNCHICDIGKFDIIRLIEFLYFESRLIRGVRLRA